jgi:hypothetical protein
MFQTDRTEYSQTKRCDSEVSMTSSDRNGPAHHDPAGSSDRANDDNEHEIYDDNAQNNTQEERSQDYNYNYPVENMTNNSTIPTQTQGTANSSYGGGRKGNGHPSYLPNI